MKFKDALKDVLTKEELKVCPTSFDQVGDIAIVDIPEQLEHKQKEIGSTLLNLLKHIKVVLKKHGIHSGKYRLQQYRIIAGERRKTTIHKESGVRLKLHVEKSYYSPRSSNERLRIAGLVKDGESILVMFSGIAPFPLVIARNAKPGKVIGIELNPHAHDFAMQNLKMNKLGKVVSLIHGDVRMVIPELKERFDRIIMPLPKDAELFLEDALKVAQKGTMIHLYQFGQESEIPEMKVRAVKLCEEAGRKVRIEQVVKAGNYAPYVYRLCLDIKVLD